MDPNVLLKAYRAAVRRAGDEADTDRQDPETMALWEAVDVIDTLLDWLVKGGFAPDWRIGLLED